MVAKNGQLYIIIIVLFFLLGIILGTMLGLFIAEQPAYPWIGDWNGDGILDVADVVGMIDEFINGPRCPEIVLGPEVPLD